MKFSRRHFLKAAGATGPGMALSTVGAVAGVVAGESAVAAQTAPPLAIPAPMTQETSSFNINGKAYRAQYEARALRREAEIV